MNLLTLLWIVLLLFSLLNVGLVYWAARPLVGRVFVGTALVLMLVGLAQLLAFQGVLPLAWAWLAVLLFPIGQAGLLLYTYRYLMRQQHHPPR